MTVRWVIWPWRMRRAVHVFGPTWNEGDGTKCHKSQPIEISTSYMHHWYHCVSRIWINVSVYHSYSCLRCLSILYFHRNQVNCSHCQLNNITPSLNICVNLSHKFIVKSWMDPLSSTAFQREKSGATLLAFRFAVFMSTCWIISYLANLESAGVLRFLCPSFGQLSSWQSPITKLKFQKKW